MQFFCSLAAKILLLKPSYWHGTHRGLQHDPNPSRRDEVLNLWTLLKASDHGRSFGQARLRAQPFSPPS